MTSGTIFASRQLGFVDLLAAIYLPANAAIHAALLAASGKPLRDGLVREAPATC